MTPSLWARLAAILGFLGVAIGAFGAHGLRGHLQTTARPNNQHDARHVSPERRLEVFETGVRYHMYHALALLAVAWIAAHSNAPNPLCGVAGWAFLTGIILFSGSLYTLGLTGIGWLGAITPLGGIAFLIGWGALAWAAGTLTPIPLTPPLTPNP